MVAYGAMEGERIYIRGSLYMGQECQNVEGVLPNRIFTHEDAKMLRPRNIFRKKITKQDGSEEEPLGSDTSSSSPSLTATSNTSSVEERDSETEFEFSKTFGGKRKEKIVHRILCEGNQDIQVVEVGDDDESDENLTPSISTIVTATTTTTTTSVTPASTTTTTVSAAATPKKSRIDKLCEKLRENSSFGKSEDVKYTNQLEDSIVPSKNGLASGKESPQPSKTLLQESGNQNEATVTPPPLPPSLPTPPLTQPATSTTEKTDSTAEKDSLKLLRHHLRKESVATTSTSFAESDMKRESYMKSPHVTAEKEKLVERNTKKSLSIKAQKTSDLAAKLDIILPITYTASLKKSKSRDGLSACPIVLTAVRHRLKECSVVVHDCKVTVGESCSALLFEQKTYSCCQDIQNLAHGNQNEKSGRTSDIKASKQSSSFSQSQQKSERKRTRPKTSPSLPSFSLPTTQALPATSSLAPQSTSWTAANPLSSLQQPPLKSPRVSTPTSIPTSVFPAVTHQPQRGHLKSTTPSSVPQLTDDSKKAYPLLTQALTSIGSITHSSAPRFRQELYLSSNSGGGTGLLGQRPLDPSPLSSVSHSQFMPTSQEMMYVKPEASAEHDLRSSIFSSQFASFMDHVNRPLHPQEFAEAYSHPKPQFPKWLHLKNQLLSYD